MTTHETVFRVCHTFMCLDAKTFDMHEKFAAIHIFKMVLFSIMQHGCV